MAYTAHLWQVGEAITMERMRAIENALAATSSASDLNTSNITDLTDTVSRVDGVAAQNALDIGTLQSTISGYSVDTEQGRKAWQQLVGAGVIMDNNGIITYSLDNIIDAISGNVTTISNSVNGLSTQITGAVSQNAALNLDENSIDTLAKRIGKIYYEIGELRGTVSTVSTYFDSNNPTNILVRLTRLDGNPTTVAELPTRTIKDLISEIADAHVSTTYKSNGLDTTYGSLDARFEANEGKISALETEIAAAHRVDVQDDTINTRFSAIEFEINAARNGQTDLDTRLDGIDTRIDAIDGNGAGTLASRMTAVETSARDNASNLNTLTGRVNTVEGDLNTATTGIKDRLAAIESEIDAANGNSTLDARFDAIEGDVTIIQGDITTLDGRLDDIDDGTNTTISNINTKINTIANELAMLDNGTIVDTNTKIDKLEADVSAFASELAMTRDQNGALVDTNTRVDQIANAISHEADANNNDPGGLTERMAAVETIAGNAAVASTVTAALLNINTAISHAAEGNDPGGLTERIAILEGKDTIVVNKPANGSNYTNNVPNIASPSTDADYLIADDNGNYFYWRYINNAWKLISGAGNGSGGGGTSSAEFYASLEAINDPSDTVDYFIGSNGNYIHYRYLNDQWVMILPAGLINAIGVNQNGGLSASALGSETNLLANFTAIKTFNIITVYDDDGVTPKRYTITITTTDGETSTWDLAAGGGGGGSASLATAALNRVGSASITTISGENCPINFTFTASDDSGESLAGSVTALATWSINRQEVATSEVIINDPTNNSDYNSFNIGPYLQPGTNNISLSVSVYINDELFTRTKTWSVEVKNFSLVWEYNDGTVNEGTSFEFTCTPYGSDISKTIYLKIDDNVYDTKTNITTSGTALTLIADNSDGALTHGIYTAEILMTATINGQSKSVSISHEIIVIEDGNNTPIITASLPAATVDLYTTLAIPFVVYTPNNMTSNVTLEVNGEVVDTRTGLNRSTQYWYYSSSTAGSKTLTITSGETSKTLELTVLEVQINNEEISNYVFKLKASDIPSNTALLNWNFGGYTAELVAAARATQAPTAAQLQILNTTLEFSNNFNWVTGGIETELDENNQIRQFIRVKSGTRMTIPYKIFASDPRTNGSNFKIIFKIDNCRNYDATAMSNMDLAVDNDPEHDTYGELVDNIGIRLNAHNAVFKSSTAEISTLYGEEEYTELEFDVYKSTTATGTAAVDPYIMAWVDGVMTTARPYSGEFAQSNAKKLVIGSDDCDICVYLVKYYAKALSRNDHIINFIADAPNGAEMIRRYNRNDILEGAEIDWNKLATKNPDCRVWKYDIERMTIGKKDAVNVYNFEQIWKGGSKYYNITAKNAKIQIQGTSSFNYRRGTANTDIDFSIATELKDGNGNNLLDDSLEYKGIKINDNSLPIMYSNTKVNFASCEQVNNMCNAEWYQRYQPFPSLSARDCMEFAMGVQFIRDRRESSPTDAIVLFEEKENFDPDMYYMYSIANMGTSKKNTHIFHSANECCIEIKENTSDALKMKSFDSEWTLDGHDGNYEIRYPKKPNTAIADGWERFVTWMVTNNPNAATGAALDSPVTFAPYTFRGHNRTVTDVEGRHFKQVLQGLTVSEYAGTYTHDTFNYRIAKMLSECEDYMAMDSVVYHFCFIERHTMVDNVAKNTFWSSVKEVGGPNNEEGYWIWDLSKNYDNDTADGNNNNGLLVLDYGYEAGDTLEGTPVFNGSDAVWFVFISHLYEACRRMFQDRESIGAWDKAAYHNYLTTEQHKVPERVWNECYWYAYLRTYERNIEPEWIAKLDGGQKIHQRSHFETYEEIYDSSKYQGSVSRNLSITLRGEAIDYETLGLPPQESKFIITMFNKCYLTIWIGTNEKTIKCEKGEPVTLEFYETENQNNVNWEVGGTYTVNLRVNYNGYQYKCILAHTALNGQTPNTADEYWYPVYLSLSNSVIDIGAGSMVQAIGDLSLIYPSSGQFGSAKRLRSLQIGSSVSGYNNPNMNTNSLMTLNNKMLEYLYVLNLRAATYNLNLSNCPELKYIDATGSGFTGFEFANGGLLQEAYLNAPTSLVIRNLNYLTNANLHITVPTAITSLRLEGGTLFDEKTFISQLTNLGVLRLTGINWDLSSYSPLDRLVEMMGIDENGHTISLSYLAGNVILRNMTIYEGEYNVYKDAWSPDLNIDATTYSTFITLYRITCKNYDGTDEYSFYVDNGGTLIDPYYEGDMTNAPERAPDVENSYIFGELNNINEYKEFSGWRFSNETQSILSQYPNLANIPPITGPKTLYAVYTPVKQRYTVRWFARLNELVTSTESPLNYGGGYNLLAPTIKDVQSAGYNTYEFNAIDSTHCSYKIMTGWEKLPTNIAPTVVGSTYDIYATWLERNNVTYNTVLNSDSYSVEEKLLVLREMSAARNSLNILDTFPVKLGYNGLKPGIDLISTPRRFDGSSRNIIVNNDYTPFGAGKSFTMMIDFRFELESNANISLAILLSCYEEAGDSSQGFKLYYQPSSASPLPMISFGSTAVANADNKKAIGRNISNRNIVVIRHIAGESQLYVYCGSNESGLITSYSNNSFRKTVNWSANTSDAKIVLGGSTINNSSIKNAIGTLYAVKYWEEDLGEGECMQLANWCHETITFAVADTDIAESHSSINNDLRAKIVLHALNASEMDLVMEPSIRRNDSPPASIGWNPSTVNSFYNDRIYLALPVMLLSILTTTNVPFRKAYMNTDEGSYIIGTSETSISHDYVFAPSCVEVGRTPGNHGVEANKAFNWYSPSQLTVQEYNSGSLTLILAVYQNGTWTSTGTIPVARLAEYTNIRAPYYPNRLNRTIYVNYGETNTSFLAWLSNTLSITLQPGDILIPDSESSVAYMYVEAADILAGAPLTTNNSACLDVTSGGWIESTGWWTRSVLDSNGSSYINKFMYVNGVGRISSSTVQYTREGMVYSIAL